VQLSVDGFTAHPAGDLDATVPLDVPVAGADVPQVVWDAQWESSSSVLLNWAVTTGPQGEASASAFVIYRCMVTSGDCTLLPAGISLPSSMGAHPGG
jgi:hypothetical protein